MDGNVREHKAGFFVKLDVGAHHFWIVGDDRAVVIVVGNSLTDIIGCSRIENNIRIFYHEIEDVAMDQFCPIADGVGRDGMLAFFIQVSGGLI